MLWEDRARELELQVGQGIKNESKQGGVSFNFWLDLNNIPKVKINCKVQIV